MKIEKIRIDDLVPYENNPRKNDAAAELVAKSIQDFGFLNPIIIDKENVIVAGHTRYKAALLLGLEEVPCTRIDDLTDEQVNAYRLADNKVAELAGWDYAKLEEELENIETDLSQYGFSKTSEADLDRMFNELTEAEEKEKESEKIQCPNCGEWFSL